MNVGSAPARAGARAAVTFGNRGGPPPAYFSARQ